MRNLSLVVSVVAGLQSLSAGAFETGLRQNVILDGKSVSAESMVNRVTVHLLLNGRTFCTGTLIDHNLVLTAAHCVESEPTNAWVGFGNGEIAPVGGIKIHPGFMRVQTPRFFNDSDTEGFNDIAVLRLMGSAPAWAMQAQLPTDQIVAINGISAVVAGYGATDQDRRDSGVLRMGKARLSRLRGTESLPPRIDVQNTVTCKGDSGGPVLVGSGKSLMIVGVVSSGTCNASRPITKAAEVQFHLNWIQDASAYLRTLDFL